MTTSVLIVDDQPAFRDVAREVVALTPGFVLGGEAASGEDAVALAYQVRPDLVLMDVRLPGIDGLEAAERIRRRLPRTRVLFLSTYARSDFEARLSDAGGVFVSKSEFGPECLAEAWSKLARLNQPFKEV